MVVALGAAEGEAEEGADGVVGDVVEEELAGDGFNGHGGVLPGAGAEKPVAMRASGWPG
jgi:hypothetical protein